MEVHRQPPDVALAAPVSSNSLFSSHSAGSGRQAGGAPGGNGAQRAAMQPQPGSRRPREEKLKRLGPLQWIGIIGVHSHLFDNQCKGGQRRWRTLVAMALGLPTLHPDDDVLTFCAVRGCGEWLDHGHHRASCTCRLEGHLHALHDRFQAGLHGILRALPGVTSTTDKHAIPTHAAVDSGQARAQREQGDIYVKLPASGHLASVIGKPDLVIDVTRAHTHTQRGVAIGRQLLQHKADAKYRKHTQPYTSQHIAFLPVVTDTVGHMHADAVRLLYHATAVKASGNVDNEGLIGRAREDHRFGFRRANIFRRYQADLGLLLAALGAQQRHHPQHFSFVVPRSRRS